MQSYDINFLAILVSGIVAMIIGSLWYSPALFGKQWIKLSGMTNKKIKKAKQKGMGKTYFIAFISTLIMAYVLAVLLKFSKVATISKGFKIAFLIWIGFFATTQLGTVLWQNKPFKLYLIDTLHYLVTLLVISAILTSWV